MMDIGQNLPVICTRFSYELGIKKRIVTEAYSIPRNLRPTARKFNVQANQIRLWKRKFDGGSFPALSHDDTSIDGEHAKRFKKDNSRFTGGGRKCSLSKDVINKLKRFYDGKRNEDLGVSLRLMTAECRLLDPSVSSISSKALEGRVYRLLVKWDASWRRGTHKAQNTRHDIVVMNEFRSYVRMKASLLGVDCRAVFNADETNIYFSMEGKYTYAKRGSRTVAIKGATSSDRCTVMLGANLAGDIKLPPFVIYTGSSGRTGRVRREVEGKLGFPLEMEYSVQPKGWMDEELMLIWIERVWKPSVAQFPRSYLILDCCTSHMTTAVKEAFDELNTEIDFIPKGYTCKLQPMDVGINKPFKNYTNNQFNEWLVANKDKKPKRVDVAWWIWKAWTTLSDTIVRNSWRGCGISIDDATTGTTIPNNCDAPESDEDDSILDDDCLRLIEGTNTD
jgi:transposase-like protein